MNLNTKLRKLRNLRKISQAEIADTLQVSQTAYNKWEAGTAIPSLNNILKISRFYDIYIEELINEDPIHIFEIIGKRVKLTEKLAYSITKNQNEIIQLIRQQNELLSGILKG
ncbi:helix-turn-helix transcriptional regulator [Elizabethkingia meningoseptica]|uniref:Transcriptional regulator n=2 Tax=Elizabethkingia meningoseptica TaxID=238 RepID=A0A1V3U2X3_ELIME|nr:MULTISPECIES: helix-turn-helix transcriptional regulator [Elizabethkingia]AQX04781.1 transcriptional regulator [Elizabethkingia meningoseptica]AQX12242.1 transcriptional regulator [Elizabethkingia meningoseptica]AQX46823.1 transcriptional regulator [Elizabethkingia meningoseptica]EJK5330778.1 helix-turn-helix transcriptional regulator [Elizabethkingia meningoseptica]EOR29542.1 transcriptional regulator [Elizabethkingia meningoseptica ATCC 13253 = NBRC 12535]